MAELVEKLAKIIYDNVVVGSTPAGIELHFVEQAVEEQIKTITTWLDSVELPIVALNQTIAWQDKLRKRKMFRKDEIIFLVRQLQGEQRDADLAALKAELK